MKFKLFLPFIFFILIVALFASKMMLNKKFENVVELRANKISFLKIQSILSGDEIKLKTNKDKYILLHFFSTWCNECISELSELKILQTKDIPLYGVAIDEERDVVANWLKKNGNYYEDVFIINSELYQNMKLNTFPMTFVINSTNNEIIELISGPITYQKLKTMIAN